MDTYLLLMKGQGGQCFGHARNARHETRFWAPEMRETPKTIILKSIMQNLLKKLICL